MEVLFASILTIGIICGALSAHVADAKGCDSGSWGLVGFLCGPLALLALAAMPDRRLRRYLRALAEKSEVQFDSLGPEQFADNPKSIAKASKAEFQTWPSDSPKTIWRFFIKAVASNSSIESNRISIEHSDIEPLKIIARDKNGETIAEAIGEKPYEFGKTSWKLHYPREQI
jgi:hypothetical protein